MRVKSRKRFLHECFETPYAKELLCSTIKIFRPVVRALGCTRSLTDQYSIFEKKKKKKKRYKKFAIPPLCDIRGEDLRPEEEMEVVARGGGGGERERGGGGGTRVRFCLSVPVRSP